MPKKLTTQKFISRSEAAHGKRYDYSKVDYTVVLQKQKQQVVG